MLTLVLVPLMLSGMVNVFSIFHFLLTVSWFTHQLRHLEISFNYVEVDVKWWQVFPLLFKWHVYLKWSQEWNYYENQSSIHEALGRSSPEIDVMTENKPAFSSWLVSTKSVCMWEKVDGNMNWMGVIKCDEFTIVWAGALLKKNFSHINHCNMRKPASTNHAVDVQH